MPKSLVLWLAVAFVAAVCHHATAEEPSADAAATAKLAAVLAEPLLLEGAPAREMKTFLAPRIIAPPKITDRANWESAAKKLRSDMLEQVVFRGTPSEWRNAKCGVAWLDTIPGGPGYSIKKFRYEALPGMWIPGLLYLPEKLKGRVPLSLHVNGHAPEGKAVDYKQLRSINLAKRGILVLNVEWFGMGQLRTPGFAHGRLNQLDLCGASGLAPFYLAMQRALDLGLELEHADAARVAVSGLSGGGWQTILISSLDERVTLANPVAGYGSFHSNLAFDDFGDSEQAPTDMAKVADYTHLTALRAPRPTLLTYNAADDCCFKSGHALGPLLEAAQPAFALHGAADRLRSHINHKPGTHNYEQENREQFYAMLGDFFYQGDASFARQEIDSKAELKTEAELHVPLPSDNVDFNRLARSLAADLPRELPKSVAKPANADRERLVALLKIPRYDAEPKQITSRVHEGIRVTTRLIKLGNAWTIPAVEFVSESVAPTEVALLVADAGRASLTTQVSQFVKEGKRVVAIDPLLWGESRIKAQDPDYLFPLFASAVGERPLGIQAAQLAAVARRLKTESGTKTVMLASFGPRSSTATLVAAAIEPAIDRADLSGGLSSFKQLIDQNQAVESSPELFAFGLLAEFDVPQLISLCAPRAIRQLAPSK